MGWACKFSLVFSMKHVIPLKQVVAPSCLASAQPLKEVQGLSLNPIQHVQEILHGNLRHREGQLWIFWFQAFRPIAEPGCRDLISSYSAKESISEVHQGCCLVIRYSSKGVGWVWGPLKFHTKLGKHYFVDLALCTWMLSCWNRPCQNYELFHSSSHFDMK